MDLKKSCLIRQTINILPSSIWSQSWQWPWELQGPGSNYHQSCYSGLSFTFQHFMLSDSKIYFQSMFSWQWHLSLKRCSLKHLHTSANVIKELSPIHTSNSRSLALSLFWDLKKKKFLRHPQNKSQCLSRISTQWNPQKIQQYFLVLLIYKDKM